MTRALAALILLGLAGCNPGGETRGAASTAPVRLAVAGRKSANPSVAAAGALVGVTWSAATSDSTDVYLAVSRDTGRTFGAAVRVNDIAGDARINSEFPPRLAMVPGKGADPDMVVVWSTRRGDSTRLQWARSTDAGATFSAAAPVPGSVAKGSRGWQSVAVDSSGRVLVMWLDHRDVPAMAMGHEHGSPAGQASTTKEDPTARAGFSKLYFASLDGTGARPITSSVCYCCKTSLVAKGGSVYGVWRHVYPGTIRDIALTVSRDGGRTFSSPARVSEDGWKIDGCPENGPAVAVDNGDQIHISWVTPPDGKSDTPLGLFYTTSKDGSVFAPRIRIPTNGPAAHTQIVARGDSSVIVAWDEMAGAKRNVGLARVAAGATDSTMITRLWPAGTVEGGWPVLASTSGGLIVAWVTDLSLPAQSITVRRLGDLP